MEVVVNIPPGGNWMDLPKSTIAKSARLRQIKKSGGRTTYYGRLDDSLPSYTINTYFNRPGNGTFIHPTQDRLISMREAARLQSFPDSYRFMGSPSSRYKQIGNAVPPLLARAIGEVIPRGICIDLFCGAGGLSEGLMQFGHNVILSSDSNSNMCQTYQINHPETNVIQSDFNDKEKLGELLDSIESELNGRTLGLLAGGPPCQGFSTAGKWNPDDARNTLLFRTLEFVKELQPENILFENVPGIRTMKKGKLLKSFLSSLENEGYSTSVFLFKAEKFGVPQRRRRVFIIGNRCGDPIEEPEVRLASIIRGKTRQDSYVEENGMHSPVSVSEAMSDLPPLGAGDGQDVVEYSHDWIISDYQRLMRGVITLNEFFRKRTE